MDREKIRNKFGGYCAYCGKKLEKIFHIDHVKPIWRNTHYHINEAWKNEIEKRKKEDNLFPACPRCNRWKNTFSLEQFRRDIGCQIERLNRYSKNYRLAKDFNLLLENEIKVIFWFEKYIKD
jgi:hypothetical protein